jgi:hypothetical protein
MIPLDVAFEEAVFQTVHVVDLQQTLDIRHSRCVPSLVGAGPNDWTQEHCSVEGTGWLDAGWATGPHPSDRSVYAFMGAEALLHAGIAYTLVRYAPAWAARAFEAVTITLDGAIVARNAHFGLKVRF